MRDKDKTKEQLLNELAKLREEIIELKLTRQNQDYNHTVPELSSVNRSSFSQDSFASFKQEYQPLNKSNKYHISELIDIPLLQQLLNSFYRVTGISHSLLDTENNILSRIGWQDICTKFHRQCPQTEMRCKQSDSYISEHLQEVPYIKYRCLNGLIDYATPIIVEGQHLATIFKGQVLHDPPDEAYFRHQAQEFGFDEESYMEALRRVPIILEEQIEPIMEFYSKLGQVLASMGIERLRRIEAADHALKEREERLRLVLEGSTDAFWDWNIETGEIYRSPRWGEIFGYSLDEIQPNISIWKNLLHPDDIQGALQKLNEHLAGRSTKYETEYRLLTKSGDWKWVLERGRVVTRNEQGKPVRAAGICQDITERKQAEASAIQSEDKFTKAFHCNADPMSITTLKEWRYVEVNDAYLRATGYKKNEVIGRTVGELSIWTLTEDKDNIIKQIQKYGSIQNIEMNFRMKSGEIRTFLMSAEIIDIDGEAHLLASNRDITERTRMDEQLKLSEERFSKAFHASPTPMCIATLEEARFIDINDSYCSIIGYSLDEILGQGAIELGIWANPADRYQVKNKIKQKESVRNLEILFRNKSGEIRLGSYSAVGLDIDGQPCLLSTLMDVTELKQMEIEMTRLDKLNLVGEMAASIGHEIRNPMTTVRGYLQILKENKDYIQEIEYFDLMIEELDTANSIITEFLSLANNKMVEIKPGDLNSVINKSLPLVQANAMIRDQNIKVELDNLPELLIDEKEMRQLVLNLVYNGLEAMPANGNITIRTYIEKGKVVLAVQDQGHGINSELMDKLGTPFFTTKEHGTGLGLAVCYRIANRHNAQIDVETSPTGTTFYVRFPIHI